MRNYSSPITDRKIRFAIVGCGRIAKNHFGAIKKHAESAELVDVCDVDSQALASAVEETGAKPHTNITGLIQETSADIVVLTTPSGLHPEQAVAVAQSGRHVMTEKPMAIFVSNRTESQ